MLPALAIALAALSPAQAGATAIRTISSQHATILGDGRGQAVYRFDRETSGRSECYGACATCASSR